MNELRKKLLKITIACLICTTLQANETKVGFETPTYNEDNEYGETIFTQIVDIYSPEVQTKKMFYGKDGDYSDNIRTKATIKVTESGTSLCSLYPGKIDEDSCSGQKLFFLSKDIPNGINYIIFNSDYTLEVNNLNNDLHPFYPLDIARNEEYYKDTGKTSSYFSLLGTLFNTFLKSGTFFNNVFNIPTTTQDIDRRQRYIANIISGLDKDHRLSKIKTNVKLTEINNPVSLIDYSETIVEEKTSCGTGTNAISSIGGGFFCSFPFFNWFLNETTTETYVINTIQQDTETSLIAIAGTNAKLSIEDISDISNITIDETASNPISIILSNFRCIFGGCKKQEYFASATQEIREYKEEEAIRMDIPIVNQSGKIINIIPIKLLAIHSVVPKGLGCTFQQKTLIRGYSDEVRVSDSALFEKTSFFLFTRWSEKDSIDGKTKNDWLNICADNNIGYKFNIKSGIIKSSYLLSEKVDTKARSLILKVKKIEDKNLDLINSTVKFKIIKMH
jgi:hypothetical protein